MTDEDWKTAFAILQDSDHLPEAERLLYIRSATDNPVILDFLLKLQPEDAGTDGESTRRDIGEPAPGDQVGGYEVLKRLGTGGMGSVYQARDNELNRLVALKFVSRKGNSHAPNLDGPLREARAASALNHPHIVTIYEVVRSGEWTAISMEYVEGVSLRDLCSRNRLPLGKVLKYGIEIVSALAATHRKGIVHRDIKPENVMIHVDDRVKVVDFGTAHVIEIDGGKDDPQAGTVNYFSPEQARGETASPASDVFSLGVVLYEMATGRHPFAQESPLATIHSIAHCDPVAPIVHNRRLPKALNRLILDMLARPVHLRPTAEDVQKRLAALLHGSGKGYRRLVVTSLVALSAAVTMLLWKSAPEARSELNVLTSTDTENHVTAAAISPDGSRIAYAEVTGTLLIRSLKDGHTQLLNSTDFASVEQLQWFPDASALIVAGHTSAPGGSGSVWKVPLDGRSPTLLVAEAGYVALSPDAGRLAVTKAAAREIWIADLKPDGNPYRLLSGDAGDIFPLVFWSADGQRLFYQRRKPLVRATVQSVAPNFETAFKRTLEVVDISTGKALYVRDISMYSAVVQPDGRLWFLWPSEAHSLNLWEMRIDPATAKITQPPRLITNYSHTALAGLSASRDGKRLVTVRYDYQSDVYIADYDSAAGTLVHSRRLTLDRAADYPHSFSPDGNTVFFESNRNGSFDIFRQSVGDKHATYLAGGPGRDEYNPTVTPDGKWVLFGSAGVKDGNDRTLERIPVDGGQADRVPIGGVLDYFDCALPGGKRCVLRTTENGQFVFWELDPVRGKGKELVRVPANAAAIMGDWSLSSDGTEVAIPNHDEQDPFIRIISLDDPAKAPQVVHLRNSTGMINGVAHSATDDGWFVGIRKDNELYRTSPWLRLDLTFVDRKGNVQPLRDVPIATWAVPAPGGRRIAFLDGAITANAVLLEQ